MKISIEKTTTPKPKPPFEKLGFGNYFSDHMFTAKYTTANSWHDCKITPYQPFELDPAASVLHYGQALFEGMKAFYQKSGEVALFRPEFNYLRMREGADRLCMPFVDQEIFVNGIRELIKVDSDWVPRTRGSSLYIRPTLIGTEGFLGVRPANELLFFVILSPVSSYYASGIAPVKIWIEEEYLRAGPGGLGATKAAANYAGSLKAALEAKKKGYAQVLWLDVARKYVEEVGTMNVFFVFKNEIVTPALDGTILSGGVRDSILQILKLMGKPVSERKISLQEIIEGQRSGNLIEAFGSGTAAVVTPIGELSSKNGSFVINGGHTGELTQKLYNELTAIQYGERPDTFNWLLTV